MPKLGLAREACDGRTSLGARLAAAASEPRAEIRGVFFQIMEVALRDDARGSGTRHRSYGMYPLGEYLTRAEELSASIGPTCDRALIELHRTAASFLLSHPGARLFLGARDREPHVLLQRLERSRSLMASYGHWRVHGGRGHVTIAIRDEYVWIEEVWATIVRSVFPHLGIDRATVTVHLDGPFDGVMEVRW